MAIEATYFATRSDFRDWLERNHASAQELWVGFYKKGSGKPSVTYPESVDEALCFGWIDGVRKSVDELSYVNRFTPRKARSNWSAVNIKRAKELTELGLMHPAGLAAFAARDEQRSAQYENAGGDGTLDAAYEKAFRANPKAWEFFLAQPPSYRRNAGRYVMSAKQEATRRRRLEKVISDSEAGLRLGP